MKRICDQFLSGLMAIMLMIGMTACGNVPDIESAAPMADGTLGNIFASEDDIAVEGSDKQNASEYALDIVKGPVNITVSLPSANLELRQNNKWNDRLVADINECLGVDIQWNWYASDIYYEQIEKDILSGEVSDIILTNRSKAFLDAAETGLFWDLAPYIDDYDNLSSMSEVERMEGAYNGKMYGVADQVTIYKGLLYRMDWLENLGLEEPTDWEKFSKMLYAFTYGDPDGNGVNDTVGLYLDSDEKLWDVMESWFGVPNVWGIDGNGDLIHESRTEEYLEAYRAFRELYAQGVINIGNNGFVDFRNTYYATAEGIKTSLGGCTIDTLLNSYNLQKYFVEQKITTEETVIIKTQACVDTGNGTHCYPWSRPYILAVSTKRIKTEEQLRSVLQFLNDVNNAECYDLISYGWEGESYEIIDDTGMISDTVDWTSEQRTNGFAQFNGADYIKILTNHVTEENSSKIYVSYEKDELLQMEKMLNIDNANNLTVNYGFQFLPQTYEEKGEELDAMLYGAEMQYVTGEIDEAGFRAALDVWWEAGGEKMTEEINLLYHAAGY